MNLLGLLMSFGMVHTTTDPALRYLALGDSYTIGESVATEERWPALLVDKLRRRGIHIEDPRYVATTGWTTDELSAGMDRADLEPCWDLVSLLIGVNNQYRGRSVEDYRVEYRALLERAINLAGDDPDRVFVLSIPDWAMTPFGEASDRDLERMSREIDVYNAAKREITEDRGVLFFDITPSTRKLPADRALAAEDGLHPSGKLYGRWVEQIERTLADRINQFTPCPRP
ncbi:MAG: SGNH/GDSL hydrolase family protein [Xanthomonadales bacterium]|nr:SGNH/GDSL hydrolase family protein [Xanthomonadales bacterium]